MKNTFALSGGTALVGKDLRPLERAVIVVRDGRIAAIGTSADGLLTRGTRVIDTTGMTILPGLIDAHAHFDGLGRSLDIVKLVGTTSFDDVIARVKAFAPGVPGGEWILGRGWDQNDWDTKAYPSAAQLDASGIANPIWLDRVDGHASVANSAAMKAAGITRATKDPDGGKIVRDAEGNPTGVFIDNACDLVRSVIPRPGRAVQKSRLERAARVIAANGLTEVHQAGNATDDDEVISILKELADEGKLPIRVYVMLSDVSATVEQWLARGPLVDDAGRVTVRAIKAYADGALGSRGAALLEAYSDDAGNTGLLTIDPKHLLELSKKSRARGFQVCTHAIGDRGVRLVLDAYRDAGVKPEERFRVEHAQVIALDDIPRFGSMGVIASMQPTHATSDMPWAEDRLGSGRVRGAYAWRRVLDGGSRLALGSDFPVEDVNPFYGIYSAITRQDQAGQPRGGWYPSERLTAAEAVRGFSYDAAYAGFEEGSRGSIDAGKLADFTIVDRNPLTSDPVKVFETNVRYTIVGGQVVYQSK